MDGFYIDKNYTSLNFVVVGWSFDLLHLFIVNVLLCDFFELCYLQLICVMLFKNMRNIMLTCDIYVTNTAYIWQGPSRPGPRNYDDIID